MDYLSFEPIYKERVWGGRRLQSSLGRTLLGDSPIGESWEIVDRDTDQSIIAHGCLKGKTIREALNQYSHEIMGPNWDKNRPFPILLKWLDCADRLSLQVHPPKKVAKDLGGESKTEAWYVAEADPGASLIVGLKNGVTQSDFEAALEAGTLESCVQQFGVEAGDSVFVPSGRLHAIDKGSLILEVQENSDTTYRVYDWGRVGLDGSPRELHIEESLMSINFNDFEPEKCHPKDGVLVDSQEFKLKCLGLNERDKILFVRNDEPRIISVVAGAIVLKGDSEIRLERGSNVLLPYSGNFSLECCVASSRILVTERFNN